MNICLDLSPVVHQKAVPASYVKELATQLVQNEDVAWKVFHHL